MKQITTEQVHSDFTSASREIDKMVVAYEMWDGEYLAFVHLSVEAYGFVSATIVTHSMGNILGVRKIEEESVWAQRAVGFEERELLVCEWIAEQINDMATGKEANEGGTTTIRKIEVRVGGE